MTAPLGVILAGGRASRMGGGDKGRLMLGDQSLLDLVITRLTPQVSGIALNANGDAARFTDTGLPVLPDSLAGHPGPLAGVLAGLDWAAELGADSIVSVAADTPFFPENLVSKLQAASGSLPLALAASRDSEGKLWRQPTFGLWPVALREELRQALTDGLRKVVQWTDAYDAATAEFPSTDFDPFFNVNTPEDLEAARTIYEAMA
ncbi:molybdenum cofactor guanylyltransferase MobA [Cognatishimia sp.]|uniref:molybdenum cofactor guanylyltransferase MobA n=1 Tax=Cognatishimia sp. TaxID=2211648 RepID=UPI003515B85A|nr:molybdenum cofactor guanylyltransferase MobA [Cognatishimia sp.]